MNEYDGEYFLTKVTTDGNPNNVRQTINESTVVTVHNHGNQSPPSPRDLLSVCQLAADSNFPNFQGHLVYCDREYVFYGLIIANREKAAQMAEFLKNEIGENNDFISKGEARKLLKKNRNVYYKMNKTNAELAKLALLSKEFGNCIKIIEYQNKAEGTAITMYAINDKNQPVKCE